MISEFFSLEKLRPDTRTSLHTARLFRTARETFGMSGLREQRSIVRAMVIEVYEVHCRREAEAGREPSSYEQFIQKFFDESDQHGAGADVSSVCKGSQA